MTAARLSPAANLLRNSKLFALPPSLALPSAGASSEPVARSDTATTPYPIYAAIETPEKFLERGDWGLKRSLPLKSTTKTGTPVIRIQRGIDTPEHTVDFESAADHVLTLQKWQQLHLPVQHPQKKATGRGERKSHGVFNPSDDNTTNVARPGKAQKIYTGVWPDIDPNALMKEFKTNNESLAEESGIAIQTLQEEAALKGTALRELPKPKDSTIKRPQKRWRYVGPWLAGMTGMEFDKFLKNRVRGHKYEASFRQAVRLRMAAEIQTAAKAEAMEEGLIREERNEPIKVTDEEVDNYIRALRRKPELFGPFIAELFDLPDGPRPKEISGQSWDYGRETSATQVYSDSGPPGTHPSAGLAYSRSRNYASNDPVYGPQDRLNPVVGRVLKNVRTGSGLNPVVGVAGFVAPYVDTARVTEFQPTQGGQKMLVNPTAAMVAVDGKLDLNVEMSTGDYLIKDDMPVRRPEVEDPIRTRGYGVNQSQVIPMIDSIQTARFGSNKIPLKSRPAAQTKEPGVQQPSVLQWLNRLSESASKDSGRY